MADITKQVLKQNGEVKYDYMFSVLEMHDNEVRIHLSEPKFYQQPEKGLYTLEIYKNDELDATIENVLFRQYQVLMDNGVFSGMGEEQQLKYTQNFFIFEIIQ